MNLLQGAKYYFMRNILHDWPDKPCQKILSNVAKAMTKGHSKILIEDMVLPDAGADWIGASSDLLMLMMLDGAERTTHHWESIIGSAGMKINKIWRGPPTQEAIIEVEFK